MAPVDQSAGPAIVKLLLTRKRSMNHSASQDKSFVVTDNHLLIGSDAGGQA